MNVLETWRAFFFFTAVFKRAVPPPRPATSRSGAGGLNTAVDHKETRTLTRLERSTDAVESKRALDSAMRAVCISETHFTHTMNLCGVKFNITNLTSIEERDDPIYL